MLVLIVFVFLAQTAAAQPERGDPPVAALITISEPDANGIVTIEGAAGAVFPAAQVAVRNLYTEEVVYTNAGITGSFTARLYGPGTTPFWISPAESIPADIRGVPGSLPGGPGTIVYGNAPAPRTYSLPVTQIIVDGQLDDWPQDARISDDTYALLNTDSLYLAVSKIVPDDALLAVAFSLDTMTYELALDPALPQTGLLREIAPQEREPTTLSYTVATDDNTLELRIPRFRDFNELRLEQTYIRMDDIETGVNDIGVTVTSVEERDGIVYPGGPLSGNIVRFGLDGPRWSAGGRLDRVDFTPGETMTLELDTRLRVPDLPESLVGLQLIGTVGLQPVVVGADGSQNVAALLANNGWSNVLTPSGLAVDNLRGDVHLGTVTVTPLRRDDTLLAGFRFELTLPDRLPPGYYVPTFSGSAQIGDGEVFSWTDEGVFGAGLTVSRVELSRLPLVLRVGTVEAPRLLWTLFYDHPSDGSRGILADEDRQRAALSNRVHFNAPTYVLPPGAYPLEPYLLNFLPNMDDTSVAPLLPLLFPGGRLKVIVTRPDGTVDDLPGVAIVQNQVSVGRFGSMVPQSIYRLTSLNPAYTDYAFDLAGEYQIDLTGSVEDVFGNRYTGGGTYTVLIANPLDLTPGVLPGTPFHVGDVLFLGGQIAPGFPAKVQVRLRLFNLDGSVDEQTFSGTANRHGYFALEPAFRFFTPGEYVLDYDVQHTAEDGSVWAASLRSAGVVSAESSLVARGVRGLVGDTDLYRPAWFTTELYPPPDSLADLLPRPYYPYHAGDVATIRDGMRPVLQAQDLDGAYETWLLGNLDAMAQPVAVDALPLQPVLGGTPDTIGPALRPDFFVNEAYAYISATRPDVTASQYILGLDDPALPLGWDGDDNFNAQIGAGSNRPGDYLFLFGGAVVRNGEAGISDTAPYAALAVVDDGEVTVSAPYNLIRDRPLLTVREREYDLFFHPTGLQPGQVMVQGDTLAAVGQVAPTLTSQVAVTITSPSGSVRRFEGLTNATGYFYDPANDFMLDEIGVWTVRIIATPAGFSSAGMPEPPLPVGGILGTPDDTFPVFVTAPDALPLDWTQGVDISVRPGTAFNITSSVPAGWTDAAAYYMVRTPSYVLDAGTLQIFGGNISYQYNPATLAREFPNLEFEGRGEGPSASDVVTITVAITGLDENGDALIRTRTVQIFHDRLRTFEGVIGE